MNTPCRKIPTSTNTISTTSARPQAGRFAAQDHRCLRQGNPARIGNSFDCSIDNLRSAWLRDYFTEPPATHSWSTVKLDLYGLKFFYSRVLQKHWEDIPLIKPQKTSGTPNPFHLTL